MTIVTVSALADHQLLHGMPERDLGWLAQTSSLTRFPAGHRLFEPGGVAKRFWLIRSGQVALDLQLPGHGRVVIETLGRGEMVGLSWLARPYQWQYGAKAVQPTEAFEFDANAVRQRCEIDAEFGYELTKRVVGVLIDRLNATRAKLSDLCCTPDLPG
jgi:CRP/FNR family transcriptional regulator, cyclic AMP receptor protein